jgi:hypothetical protein
LKAPEPVTAELDDLRNHAAEITDLANLQPVKLAELREALLHKSHEARDPAPAWSAWNSTDVEETKIIRADAAVKPKAAKSDRNAI